MLLQVAYLFLGELSVGQEGIDACCGLAGLGVDQLLGYDFGLPLAFPGLPALFFRSGQGIVCFLGIGSGLCLAGLKFRGILRGLLRALFAQALLPLGLGLRASPAPPARC